jgi:hypothetical protein
VGNLPGNTGGQPQDLIELAGGTDMSHALPVLVRVEPARIEGEALQRPRGGSRG